MRHFVLGYRSPWGAYWYRSVVFPCCPVPHRTKPTRTGPSQPNPTQPPPTRPNPTGPNSVQPNPTQPDPTKPNPAQPIPTQPQTHTLIPTTPAHMPTPTQRANDNLVVVSETECLTARENNEENHYSGGGVFVFCLSCHSQMPPSPPSTSPHVLCVGWVGVGW